MATRNLRHRFAFVTALLALGLAPLGCGGGSEEPAPAKPAPTEPAPPTPAAPEPTPEPEPAAPVAAGGDVASGKALYTTYCSSCHGVGGNGDGPVSASLNPKPAKHTDGAYMNALSDEHMTKVIKLGGPSVGKSPMMAPWGGTLNDAQIADVIAYVRSLANPPYPGS